ncbi:MAG: hypothetical protein IJS90_08650 [Clostridia bacterium]|nr:hypothetical protein [Clostridia bacterium]
MNTALGLVIMAQLALTMFIIWGYMHEDLFVALENRMFARRVSRRAAKKLRLIVNEKRTSGEDAA